MVMQSTRIAFVLLVVVTFASVLPGSNAQGRCIYNACNFNRRRTRRKYHGLLTFLCRRCCTDISRLRRARKKIKRNLRLNPVVATAARRIKNFMQLIFNRRTNRREVADRIRQARNFLEDNLETLENEIADEVFNALDTAIGNCISTANRAWGLAEGIQGGWDLAEVVELIGAIAEADGYALEIVAIIAALLA